MKRQTSSARIPGPELSSRLENILEHLFIGELLRTLWSQGRHDVEILRAEVDAFGYDLVIETGGIQRHIQLKASKLKAKTSKVDVSTNLAAKPSGCVVWMLYDPASLALGPFRWLGGRPGEKLPSLGAKIAYNARATAKGVKTPRLNLRQIRKGRFDQTPDMATLAWKLFGPAA